MTDKKITVRFNAVDGVSGTLGKIKLKMRAFNGLSRSFAGLSRSVGGLGRQLSGTLGPLTGISGIGAGVALTKTLTTFASIGDEAAKMSRALNMSAGAYRELGYWAERSGLSAERWGTAQRALNSRLNQAATGQNEKVSDMLKALNVDLREADGTARATDEVMADLAEAFEVNTDPIARMQISLALFGEEVGVYMVDALSQGRRSMEELRAEARRLGITMTEEQAKAAEKLTDQWTNLSRSAQGLAFGIGSKLAPVLGPLIEQLTNWIVVNRDLISSGIGDFATKISNALFPASVHANEFVGAMGEAESLGGLPALVNNLKEIASAVQSVVDLMGGWENAAFAAAAVLNGPLIAAVLNVGMSLGSVVMAVGSLMAKLVMSVPAIVSALTWAGVVLGGIASGIAKLGMVLATSPIGMTIAAIAYAVSLLYRNWDGVVAWFQEMFENLAKMFGGAIEVISGILTGDFGRAFEGLKQIWEGFSGYVMGWGDALMGIVGAVVDDVLSAFDGLSGMVEPVIEIAQRVIGGGGEQDVPGQSVAEPGKRSFFGSLKDSISGFFGGDDGTQSLPTQMAAAGMVGQPVVQTGDTTVDVQVHPDRTVTEVRTPDGYERVMGYNPAWNGS